jgi:pimeloyl-ACP methyl ester carboxylesterase
MYGEDGTQIKARIGCIFRLKSDDFKDFIGKSTVIRQHEQSGRI